jgi:hypothetical protein
VSAGRDVHPDNTGPHPERDGGQLEPRREAVRHGRARHEDQPLGTSQPHIRIRILSLQSFGLKSGASKIFDIFLSVNKMYGA